jgi:DNA polymerase III epsilon subunit-like protein
LLDLKKDLDSCKVIVGHNLSFDIAMLQPEFSREKIDFRLDEKFTICTMRSSTAWCRLPKLDGRSGFKWPKLEEVYYRLFGRYFEGAHDALADVVATKEVYFELIKREIIPRARNKDQIGATLGPNKKGEKAREVRLSPAIERPMKSTKKAPALIEQKLDNAGSVSDVFSWDWSAPGGEKLDLLTCPSCSSHCKHRVNLRKRAARCLTCFAEYSV